MAFLLEALSGKVSAWGPVTMSQEHIDEAILSLGFVHTFKLGLPWGLIAE